jgi:hypothetical protein
MKNCKVCKERKELEEFYKAKTNKDGRDGTCKLCRNSVSRKWYSNNKDYHKKLTKTYYENNKDKAAEYTKQWYINNKDRKLEVARKWEINNKDKRNEIAKRFRSKVKNKVSNNFSRMVYHSLKGNKQGMTWESVVGYSLVELIDHLENKFHNDINWENYGSEWSIDHIRPIQSFNIIDYNCDEFKKCWELSNLQPLLTSDNIRKSDKWDGTSENKTYNLNYISYEQLVENLK